MKGSYVLLIQLAEERTITAGRLKAVRFSRGYYAYVGSALGGFKSRLDRHLRRNKKHRWHIDYLLQMASINGIILCESQDRIECTIARALGGRFDSIPGFGASDCRCKSHLFFNAGEMKATIMAILSSLDMGPGLMANLSVTE